MPIVSVAIRRTIGQSVNQNAQRRAVQWFNVRLELWALDRVLWRGNESVLPEAAQSFWAIHTVFVLNTSIYRFCFVFRTFFAMFKLTNNLKFFSRFISYIAASTLHLHTEVQSVNAAPENNRCSLWESCEGWSLVRRHGEIIGWEKFCHYWIL